MYDRPMDDRSYVIHITARLEEAIKSYVKYRLDIPDKKKHPIDSWTLLKMHDFISSSIEVPKEIEKKIKLLGSIRNEFAHNSSCHEFDDLKKYNPNRYYDLISYSIKGSNPKESIRDTTFSLFKDSMEAFSFDKMARGFDQSMLEYDKEFAEFSKDWIIKNLNNEMKGKFFHEFNEWKIKDHSNNG